MRQCDEMKESLLLFVYALLALGFVNSTTVPPEIYELQQCFEKEGIDAKKAFQSLTTCLSSSFSDFEGFSGKLEPAKIKSALESYCRYDSLSQCMLRFKSDISVCVVGAIEKNFDDNIGGSAALHRYVCKDNGATIVDLVSMPENKQCFARLYKGEVSIQQTNCTGILMEIQKDFQFFSWGNEKHCRWMNDFRKCLSEELHNLCGDKGFFDYLSDMFYYVIKQSMCKNYDLGDNNLATLARKDSAVMVLLFTCTGLFVL